MQSCASRANTFRDFTHVPLEQVTMLPSHHTHTITLEVQVLITSMNVYLQGVHALLSSWQQAQVGDPAFRVLGQHSCLHARVGSPSECELLQSAPQTATPAVARRQTASASSVRTATPTSLVGHAVSTTG